MRILVGHTYEMIDEELAIQEILQQLDLDSKKLANTVGIITCFPVFIETGVVKALCDALPFDIVGATTLGNAVYNMYGSVMPMLSIMVLTSDDNSFVVTQSSSINDLDSPSLLDLSEHTAAQGGKLPNMVMAFIPPPRQSHAADVLDRLEKSMGTTIPIFGMQAWTTENHDLLGTEGAVLSLGEVLTDKVAMLLMYGNKPPRFLMASVSDKYIKTKEALITRTDSNILQEVNGLPFNQYMDSLGLDTKITYNGVPLMLDYKNGTKPIARAIFELTPEGYAVCGGDVPCGGTVSVGFLESQDLLDTATILAEQIQALPDVHGAFMISCLGRNQVLGNDITKEMEMLHEVLGDSIPYAACYSGGEIAPLQDKQGRFVNFLHNYSIVACIF